MERELFKKMYLRLFSRVTDAIEATDIETMRRMLIEAQQEVEEMYISGGEIKE